MPEISFEPRTGQLRIPGTSYSIQVGKINGKWAIRLMKGTTVVDVLIYKDDDLEGELPNPDVIINWVLGKIVIPGINPVQIKKTIQFLLKEAKDNRDNRKVKAHLKEAMAVKLKKVPILKSNCKREYRCIYCDFKILYCLICGKNLSDTAIFPK